MLISLISGAAAAIILFAIGIKLNIDTSETTIPIAHQATPDIVCHVNGQLVADNEAAIAETNRVLEGVMGDVNLAMAEVKRLNILYK